MRGAPFFLVSRRLVEEEVLVVSDAHIWLHVLMSRVIGRRIAAVSFAPLYSMLSF